MPVVRTGGDVKLYTISWFALPDRDCGDALGPCRVAGSHVAWSAASDGRAVNN